MLGTGAETSQGKCYTSIDVKPANESSSDAFAASETSEDYEYVACSEDDELMPQDNVNADVREESKGLKYTLWGVYFLFWQICLIKFDVWLLQYLNTFPQVRQYTKPPKIELSGFKISAKIFQTKLRPLRCPDSV
ncbi:hypothetical protein ACLKA7_007925 [Drosophila subpalustris]